MHKALDYHGRCVVLTGAAGGIGRRLAQTYADAGATLELVDRDAEALAELVESLETQAPLHASTVDLADWHAVQNFADDLACRSRCVDVLVNNAGVEYQTPITEPSAEADACWAQLLDNNVSSMQRLTRALLPRLRAGASVINQASIWGLKGVSGFSAYAASKHAVVGLTRSLAWELGPRRIRVNAVCPGWIGTEAAMRSLRVMAQENGRSEAEELVAVLAAQAIPELLTPADLSGTFLFLGSPLAAALTGQALSVSHGEVMH